MAQIKRNSSLVGAGCFIQFIGIVCFIMGFVYILSIIAPIICWPLGVWLLFAGSRKAVWYECSACGTKLSGRKLKICPNCNSKFE